MRLHIVTAATVLGVLSQSAQSAPVGEQPKSAAAETPSYAAASHKLPTPYLHLSSEQVASFKEAVPPSSDPEVIFHKDATDIAASGKEVTAAADDGEEEGDDDAFAEEAVEGFDDSVAK